MKIKTTLSNLDGHLSALVYSSPVTAARSDLLGLLTDVLTASSPFAAEALREAATPLREALGAEDVRDVWRKLVALPGRPPRTVTAALRSPDLVDALVDALGLVGAQDAAKRVTEWGPRDTGEFAVVPMSNEEWDARHALLGKLRTRVAELVAAWRGAADFVLKWDALPVDGRSLSVAARVWQLPLITGEVGSPPTATAALYPNRLGRSAAAVACSRMNAAIASIAPDSAVLEPLAMLVAVGEAITPVDWDARDQSRAARGEIPVWVRCGMPVGEESFDYQSWWPVFAAWGSSTRRDAIAIPTAWRLSRVEADVLVWALCSASVGLAVAGTMPHRSARKLVLPTWEEQVTRELPAWEAGARSVWALMQRGRSPERRTGFPPESLLPRLDTVEPWPWPLLSDDAGNLGFVPSAEESVR